MMMRRQCSRPSCSTKPKHHAQWTAHGKRSCDGTKLAGSASATGGSRSPTSNKPRRTPKRGNEPHSLIALAAYRVQAGRAQRNACRSTHFSNKASRTPKSSRESDLALATWWVKPEERGGNNSDHETVQPSASPTPKLGKSPQKLHRRILSELPHEQPNGVALEIHRHETSRILRCRNRCSGRRTLHGGAISRPTRRRRHPSRPDLHDTNRARHIRHD